MRYLLLVLVFGSFLSFSQSGNYFLSHYSPGQDRLDNVCFQATQHPNGIIYFATRSGILQFDGRNWNVVKGNGAVYTLNVVETGEIFWGGVAGFGLVSFSSTGEPEQTTLTSNARNVFQSTSANGHIYFVNEEFVFDVEIESRKITEIPLDSEGSITGIFEVAGDVYVTISNESTLRLKDGALSPATTGPATRGVIVFSSRHDNNYIVGFSDNRVYLYGNSRTPRMLVLEDQQYLDRSVIVQGTWVSSELIALGTLRGGLIFINISTGKTYEIVNNSKGLPDNEIFTLFSDRSLSVWAAHEFGFTRIVPYLPFRSFNHYSGLQGNLLCAMTHKNSVFVGTSLGLYKLEKEDVYEEISYYVDAPQKGSKKQKERATTSDEPAPVESKKRGLFGIFKRRKSSTDEAASGKEEKSKENTPSKQKVLRTERIFRTSNFVYRKVEGIEAKVTQLVEVNGKLIAAGLGGTFEVNGLKGKLLIESPARFLYGTSDGLLFVATYSDKVHVLRHDQTAWKSEDFLVNVNDQIGHIFETASGHVWLCSQERFYEVVTTTTGLSDIQIVPFDNPNYDDLVGLARDGNLLFVNSQGFFSFDHDANKLNPIDSLGEIRPSNYFSDGQSLWYRDEHGWKVLGNERESRNSGLLNLFRNIRFLMSDKNSGDLWIITGSNELFKFYSDRVRPYSAGFPLLLKSVRNGELVQGGKRLDVHTRSETSAVVIEVVQPDYLAPQAVEYRYLIKGLDKNWSDWSQTNNTIEIPYLPPGDYVLQVESRDIFGETKNMGELKLNIIPPYWRRPWFYAFEVVLLSLLVILSFRLSVRYRIISRLLMLLTIIIMIQLVETVVGDTLETKTTPVIDFIVQVAIAMLILPVEGFLRERMLRSLERGDRLHKLILPKASRDFSEDVIRKDNG